jgi:hypothetical protein
MNKSETVFKTLYFLCNLFFKVWAFPGLFLIYFSSIFSHNSILSCNHLSSCHADISTPLTISSTMELSYLQSLNDSLYQRVQKEGVHCQYFSVGLMNGPHKLECFITICSTGLPVTNTLAYWATKKMK